MLFIAVQYLIAAATLTASIPVSIADISDPQSVRAAMAEFDALGRGPFLAKYGFRRAREYMLIDSRGNLYDSKAIIGAAHGYQFPEHGPLAADSFSGGESTVERKLSELGFEVVRIGDDWTQEEVRLTVADYLEMLDLDSRGVAYNKSAHNAALRAKMRARSKASIELKHQNISAVLMEMNLPYIPGYKPRSNVQTLLRDVVRESVLKDSTRIERVIENLQEVREPSVVYHASLVDFETLRPKGLTSANEAIPRERLPRKLDYAARDERNRRLGEAGEAWAFAYEQQRLVAFGGGEQLSNVEWVSRTLGDGLGYDIRSVSESGEPRYIEVKTTNGPGATPFVVTSNEVEFSREQGERFCLYRLFDFKELPRLFILQGPLDKHLQLKPLDYRASLRAQV